MTNPAPINRTDLIFRLWREDACRFAMPGRVRPALLTRRFSLVPDHSGLRIVRMDSIMRRSRRDSHHSYPTSSPQATVKRVQRLDQVVTALETGGETYFPITRLTIIKSLCTTHPAAIEFVLFLAQRTREKMSTSKPPKELALSKPEQYLSLADKAIKTIAACLRAQTQEHFARAYQVFVIVQGTQSQIIYPMGKYPVRLIYSNELLLIEKALLAAALPDAAPNWAYRTARVYAEEYDSRYGTGLIQKSLPMVKDIVEFWQVDHAVPIQR